MHKLLSLSSKKIEGNKLVDQVNRHKNLIDRYFEAGTIFARRGIFKEAASCFEKVLESNPR